jgi:hypothetical protein
MVRVSKRVQVLEKGSAGVEEPNFCGYFCNPVKISDG